MANLEKFNNNSNNSGNLFTSLFLTDEINKFREAEGNRSALLHKNFLVKIEHVYKKEIVELKIQPISYTDSMNRKQKMYELDYDQSLVMLLGESTIVCKGVVATLRAQQNRIQELERKNQPSWIQERTTGKEVRLLETDTIREFVYYALDSGSKNADKYYMLFTKLTNSALVDLGHIDENVKKNVKEHLGIMGLTHAKLLEMRIAETISYGMKESMHYKEIFQFAKEQVNNLVQTLSFNPKKIR